MHTFFRDTFFKFLSTPSARRATFRKNGKFVIGDISIHALREEGDRGFKYVVA